MRVIFALLALIASVSAQATGQVNYYITGSNGQTAYKIATGNETAATGVAVDNGAITLVAGQNLTITIVADAFGATLDAHPLMFLNQSTDTTAVYSPDVIISSGCTNNSNVYSLKTTGVPCIITAIGAPDDAPGTVYYRCSKHAAMTGSIISTGGATTAPTTSAPTTAGNGTSAPTTKAPTAAPKNGSAAVTMPALTSVVLAIAAAAIVA